MPDDTSTHLAAPIRAAIDATNAADSDTFLAAFAPDAVLVDWGRTFTGRDEIAGWDARENIGARSHFEVTSAPTDGDTTSVQVEVTGGGFNGPSTFAVTVDGDQITRWVITG